jgi:hypothetical protein
MKFSKAFKTFALSLLAVLLVLGNVSFVQAVTFDDTQGMIGEVSVSKLVSLGIMKNTGDSFDPEGELTRGELALMASKSLTLSSGKSAVKITDVTAKNTLYGPALKMVANGYLALDKKRNFNANNAVTYAEFSKLLAQRLGLKASWTNRPIDFLYFLDRKGVLDIDTDLDAAVTRVDAAVAYDAFLTKLGYYNTVSGLIQSVNESANRIAVKTDSGLEVITLNTNASIFVDGQYQDIASLFVGYPVVVTVDGAKKGAFISAGQTSSETGVLKFADGELESGAGKLKIGETVTKNINLNAIVRSLPSSPDAAFSMALLKQYVDAKATISGTAEFSGEDEITVLTAQIDKVEGKVVDIQAASITVSFGKFTATFTVNESTTVENGDLTKVVKDTVVTVVTSNGTEAAIITLPAETK